MSNKVKKILLFLGIYFLIFIMMYFSKVDSDLMWNYGFSYNFSKGLLMYKDYNMVIGPLYPFFTGLFMMIFGNNMISFFIVNAFYSLIIVYLIYNYNKKIVFLSLPFVLMCCLSNYNTICILFCLLVIFLDKKNKNDYLVGFILGLLFLTKINAGVLLCIPSLYYFKDIKKILKRIIGFLIPNLFIFVLFYFLGNLSFYVDYVFLGLFDFASSNVQISFFVIFAIIAFIYLIIKFIKDKDITYLYLICFLGMIYPTMNELHVMLAIFPFIVLLISKWKILVDFRNIVAPIILVIPFIGLVINFKIGNYQFDIDLKYKFIQKQYIVKKNEIIELFDNDFSNVTFVLDDNYLYKLMLNIPIGLYDLNNCGNNGLNGTKKYIDYITGNENNFIIIDKYVTGLQFNSLVTDYIRDNYRLIKESDNFFVYRKD